MTEIIRSNADVVEAKAEIIEDVQERPIPWIEQRMSEGRYTCTIREFAKLCSISYDHAREICKSRNAPPGFYSGTHFKIWLPDLPAYMTELSKKRRTINA